MLIKSNYIIGIIGLTSLILKSKKIIALTSYKGTYDLWAKIAMGDLKNWHFCIKSRD